ncbi:MAG: O-antigen ligase family protein [Bacillota bacterium]|nr:O-antigen ligase family protein [Bacillota bacterium]
MAKIASQKKGALTVGTRLNFDLQQFVWLGVLMMVFYPPFARGLFFSAEWLIAQLIIGIILIFYGVDLFFKQDLIPIKAPLTLPVLGLTLAYLMSVFVAVNLNEAMTGFIQMATYFLFYLMVFHLIKSKKNIDTILMAIFFSGIGVALIGMGSAVGIMDYPGAFAGRRINSTFQYPNTLAIYLLVTWLVGLYLWGNTKNMVMKVFYGTGIFLAITVIMGAQSRGVYLIIPIAIVFWLVGLPRAKFWEGVYYTIFTAGTSLMIGRMLIPALIAKNELTAFKWVVLGLAITAVGVAIFHWGPFLLDKYRVQEKYRQLMAIGGVIYFILMGFIYYSYAVKVVPDISRQLAPTDVVKRVETISTEAGSVVGRINYYEDAWLMIKDNMWLGTGGGGWESLYHQYKPLNYFSTEVHNHFLQVWIEAGLLGFLFFAGCFLILAIVIGSKWKKRSELDHWPALWTILIAAWALGGHSIIEFNLSLPAVALTLWTLFALGQAGANLREDAEKQEAVKQERKLPLSVGQSAIILVLAIALVYNGYNFYQAGIFGAKGAEAIKAKEYREAIVALENAHRLNPINGAYTADLAQVFMLLAVNTEDRALADTARYYADKTRQLEPYNYSIRGVLGTTHFYLGDLVNYADEMKALRDINPMEIANWEHYAMALLTSARYYLEKGDYSVGMEQATKAVNLYEEAIAYQEKITAREGKFAVSDKLYLTKGQGAFLLGDYQLAQSVLSELKEVQEHQLAAETWYAAAMLMVDEEEAHQLKQGLDPQLVEEIEKLVALKQI